MDHFIQQLEQELELPVRHSLKLVWESLSAQVLENLHVLAQPLDNLPGWGIEELPPNTQVQVKLFLFATYCRQAEGLPQKSFNWQIAQRWANYLQVLRGQPGLNLEDNIQTFLSLLDTCIASCSQGRELMMLLNVLAAFRQAGFEVPPPVSEAACSRLLQSLQSKH